MSHQHVNFPLNQRLSAGGGTHRPSKRKITRPTQTPSAMSNVSVGSNTTESKSNDERNKKKEVKWPFKVGTKIEGLSLTYTITRCMRNPGPHSEYLVTDGENCRALRLEPIGRKKLKYSSEIMTRTKNLKTSGEDKLYVLDSIEYFEYVAKKTNVLILDAHGLQLYEIQKTLKRVFTPGCVINIALQTLEAIRILHASGLISRNIKPATFSIGTGPKEKDIFMSDFRIARLHIDDRIKAPREPRSKVNWLGTRRYASIAAMKEEEQGRKDDLESWFYMILDLYDAENGIKWKSSKKPKILEEKEKLKKHELPSVYTNIPEEFKAILDLIHSWKYESVPDYRCLKDKLIAIAEKHSLNPTTCDWAGMITEIFEDGAIQGSVDKSTDNRCSGEDDFEFATHKPKKKKPERKIMNPDDVIKNGPFVWKIICLLGSGGFGDVYKVFNEKDTTKKQYALKTESEEGKKAMLRLKVEMQVMMAISDERKAKKNPFKHFVEFIDRGKSEELKSKFIVMSLVGPSLDDCRKKYKVDLSLKSTPWIIGLQTLQSLADLHSLGFLHRDIKPANFAVGLGADEPTIYMLDFGICRSYLDPKTRVHRAPRKTVKFLGTLRYASRACMKCVDQGRKDDLECWLYMLFDVLDEDNGIPWRNATDRERILATKTLFFDGKLDSVFTNFSRTHVERLLKYIDKLEYQSLPDYEFIRSKIIAAAEHEHVQMKNPRKAEWIGKLKSVAKQTNRFTNSDSENSASGGDED